MAETLHRFIRVLTTQELTAWEERLPSATALEEVVRPPRTVDLAVLDSLMQSFSHRHGGGAWPGAGAREERSAGDRWLSPRLHYALRLSRAEAADHGTWYWLARRYEDYVRWRWTGEKGVAENRWWGPHHKQALARLWWGADLFRNGADYRPVERAFKNQDFPNSYLHRPVVRCRSLGVSLLDVLVPEGRESDATSDRINDLARVLNLAAAGSPPESAVGYQADDIGAYRDWLASDPPAPASWDDTPDGPRCADTTPDSLAGGLAFAARGEQFAEAARRRNREAKK